MRRKAIIVSLAVGLLVASVATMDAQGTITLESLADRVANLFTVHDELAQRVAAIETSIAPTPTPIVTATPALSSTPSTVMVVVAQGGVRSGPGRQYNYLGLVDKGDVFQGPYQEKEGWYQFCCINDNETAWIPKILIRLKDKTEQTAWDKARQTAVHIDPRELLRYNEQHIGRFVYYRNAYVFQSLEEGLLVFLDGTKYDNPSYLIYSHTPLRILVEDRIELVAEVVGVYTYDTRERIEVTVPLLRVVELILIE